MFRLGVGAIRRNNDMPFNNPPKRTSMKFGQPQRSYSHEAEYSLRLYNFIVYLGASTKTCNKLSAVSIRTHTQTTGNEIQSEYYSDNRYNLLK